MARQAVAAVRAALTALAAAELKRSVVNDVGLRQPFAEVGPWGLSRVPAGSRLWALPSAQFTGVAADPAASQRHCFQFAGHRRCPCLSTGGQTPSINAPGCPVVFHLGAGSIASTSRRGCRWVVSSLGTCLWSTRIRA